MEKESGEQRDEREELITILKKSISSVLFRIHSSRSVTFIALFFHINMSTTKHARITEYSFIAKHCNESSDYFQLCVHAISMSLCACAYNYNCENVLLSTM